MNHDVLLWRQTSLTGSLTIAVTFSLALGGANLFQLLKAYRQGRELTRLRARTNTLESQLKELKAKKK